MDLNTDLTRRLAHLARIPVTEAEATLFTQQMADILQYMDRLATVDVQDIEPLIHPFDIESWYREDEAVKSVMPSTEYRAPPILGD